MSKLLQLLEQHEIPTEFGLQLEQIVNETVQTKLNEQSKQHEEKVNTLMEQAEAYGVHLQEKFDSAQSLLVEQHSKHIKELQESLSKQYDDRVEKMNKTFNDYSAYAIKEFIKENKEQFVADTEYKRMKKVFDGMKALFEQNLFDVKPADRVKQDELKSLQESYDHLFEQMCNLRTENNNLKTDQIVEHAFVNLTDTQKERATRLIESMNFNSHEALAKGIYTIVEEVTTGHKASVKQEKPNAVNKTSIQDYLSKLV